MSDFQQGHSQVTFTGGASTRNMPGSLQSDQGSWLLTQMVAHAVVHGYFHGLHAWSILTG